MNLVIDLGNTQAKIAVFADGEMVAQYQRKTLTTEWLQTVFNKYLIQRSMLCSVVAHAPDLVEFLTEKTDFLLLSHNTPIPIKNAYATPETLGKDRLAAVCGAFSLFSDRNCLVIDAGTCIKYDFLRAGKTYIGGSISLGITMRFRALHEFTAKLPLVPRQRLDGFFGYNTTTAIVTGVLTAVALEAKGFLDLYNNEYGDVQLILTGGDAADLKTYLPQPIYTDKNLVLKGLNAILEYNKNHCA